MLYANRYDLVIIKISTFELDVSYFITNSRMMRFRFLFNSQSFTFFSCMFHIAYVCIMIMKNLPVNFGMRCESGQCMRIFESAISILLLQLNASAVCSQTQK